MTTPSATPTRVALLGRSRPWFAGVAALGALVLLVGVFVAPERAWRMLLITGTLTVGIGVSAAAFIAMQYLSSAGWSAVIRRVPEALTVGVPVGAVLLLLSLLGLPTIYGAWVHPHGAHAHLAQAKHAWLNTGFFIGRMVVLLALWWAMTARLVANSRAQDAGGDAAHVGRNVRLSAIYTLLLVISFTVASVDWLLSVEPAWFSTIHGWYVLGSVFAGAMAVMVLVALRLQVCGALPEMRAGHLQDLGKYLFAFSFFWGYLWFSQYMLIWYSNIPEEVAHYVARSHGGWWVLFVLNPVLGCVVPFFVLLPWQAKRSPRPLAIACVSVLLGRWLDLYLLVMPSAVDVHAGAGPILGCVEWGALAGGVALFALACDWALARAPLVPRQDPYLVESLHHQIV